MPIQNRLAIHDYCTNFEHRVIMIVSLYWFYHILVIWLKHFTYIIPLNICSETYIIPLNICLVSKYICKVIMSHHFHYYLHVPKHHRLSPALLPSVLNWCPCFHLNSIHNPRVTMILLKAWHASPLSRVSNGFPADSKQKAKVLTIAYMTLYHLVLHLTELISHLKPESKKLLNHLTDVNDL